MKLLVATHESSLHHDTGRGHPERAERIPAVIRGLRRAGADVVDVSPGPASIALLSSIHDPAYIADLERFCAAGGGALDMDTVAGAASWEAALRAAAAGPVAVEALLAGEADLGYVAMRPPGHHAVSSRAMGFCLFNNVAIAAKYLTQRGGRVAIVDWDVHHGNGTQDVFYSDPAVLYLSIHQEGIYPGTGGSREFGDGEATGTNINIPVPAGTSGGFYRAAVGEILCPVIEEFAPDWLLVSSGYDAHVADPLAGLSLVSSDYGAMAQMLAPLVGWGRSLIFLEGGYDLEALEQSATATVRGWMDEDYAPSPAAHGETLDLMSATVELVGRHWSLG